MVRVVDEPRRGLDQANHASLDRSLRPSRLHGRSKPGPLYRPVRRSPSTVSRELARNAGPWNDGYALMPHSWAHKRARRLKGEVSSAALVALVHSGQAESSLESGADPPAPALPPWRGFGPPGCGGDDLSVSLPAEPRGSIQGPAKAIAHRWLDAPPATTGEPPGAPVPRLHAVHPRPSPSSSRPQSARSLGRAPHHRRGRPIVHRYPGQADQS